VEYSAYAAKISAKKTKREYRMMLSENLTNCGSRDQALGRPITVVLHEHENQHSRRAKE